MLARAVMLRTISDEELLHLETLMGPGQQADLCLVRADATETTDYISLYYDGQHLSRLATVTHEGMDMFLRFHLCVKKFGVFDEGHYRYYGQHPIVR